MTSNFAPVIILLKFAGFFSIIIIIEEWFIDNFYLLSENINNARKFFPPGYDKKSKIVIEQLSNIHTQISHHLIFAQSFFFPHLIHKKYSCFSSFLVFFSFLKKTKTKTMFFPQSYLQPKLTWFKFPSNSCTSISQIELHFNDKFHAHFSLFRNIWQYTINHISRPIQQHPFLSLW